MGCNFSNCKTGLTDKQLDYRTASVKTGHLSGPEAKITSVLTRHKLGICVNRVQTGYLCGPDTN